jgi:hypothetical protein
MNIIQKLYLKLKTLFSSSKIEKKEEDQKYSTSSKFGLKDKIKGAITFSLYENNDIDILCFLPETDKMSSDEITRESEDFGKFISSITDGLVVDSIVSLLEKNKKKSSDPNDQLFIDNILFFWAMSHINRTDKKKNSSKNHPVIRPTAVFNQIKH